MKRVDLVKLRKQIESDLSIHDKSTGFLKVDYFVNLENVLAPIVFDNDIDKIFKALETMKVEEHPNALPTWKGIVFSYYEHGREIAPIYYDLKEFYLKKKK